MSSALVHFKLIGSNSALGAGSALSQGSVFDIGLLSGRFFCLLSGAGSGAIIFRNESRRHLTTKQRAAIAAELANITHGSNRFAPKVEESNEPSITNEPITLGEAAEVMHVSRRTAAQARKTMQADPTQHERDKCLRVAGAWSRSEWCVSLP